MECETCFKTFADKIDLDAHIRRSHRAPDLHCVKCNAYKTKYKFQLERHLKKCGVEKEVAQPNRSFACLLCGATIAGRQPMIEHYKGVHDVQIHTTYLDFPDWVAFEEWRKETESSGSFKFVSFSSKNFTKTYRCFRDGFFISESSGKRRMKTKGSVKINGVCPCSLKVVTSRATGAVKVTYVPNHVGHTLGIRRLNLSTGERRSIGEKLSQNIPMDVILDSIRESIDGKYSRIQLTTRKDLANMKDSFQVTDGRPHSDGRTSVEAWIKSMESVGLVRFYKPQSAMLPEHPELNEEDFALILAFDGQIDMLRKFGSDVVCFDGTHCTNSDDFELHTLMVKDAKNQSFPCAFFISNRFDSHIMALFLSVIYNLLPQPIVPQVLMTGVAEAYLNGWCAALPKPENLLFCQWHVERVWRKNLNKIHDPYKICSVYKLIRTAMDEPDEQSFLELLQRALDFMSKDPSLADFEQFFRSEYSDNCHSWALCYRKYLGITTNMMLESMHEVLKYIFLEGNKVKRPDKGIDALVKFIRDKFFDQMVSVDRGDPTSRIASIRDGHAESLNLECTVVPQQDSSWIISSSSGTDMYEVKKLLDACGCEEKCELCLVCIHQYRCTCVDSMKSNVCKHIHRIVTVTSPNEPAGSSAEPILSDTECSNVEDSSLDDVIAENRASEENFAKAKKLISKQVSTILESASTMDHLNALTKLLAPAPHIFRAIDDGLKFENIKKVNIRSRVLSQKSLHSLSIKNGKAKQDIGLRLLKDG